MPSRGRAPLRFAFCATVVVLAAVLSAAGRPRLANGWELHRELTVSADAEPAVARHFPSFRDYHELALYHPSAGYYTSGRVDFANDFRTFPTTLAPYFGQMAAQQAFRMWAGMRHAGSLDAATPFTIAEFGAGNGLLAETILDHVATQARTDADARWRDFARQLRYLSLDRSPALRAAQQERNARFGDRFEGRHGDARDIGAAIARGSLRGAILSNELLDVFAVDKVIVSPDGSAEVAFVAPHLPSSAMRRLARVIADSTMERIKADDAAIRQDVFGGRDTGVTWLSRTTFPQLLDELAASTAYAAAVREIEFREIYVAAKAVPALDEHLTRYRDRYGEAIGRSGKGHVTYVNRDIDAFMRGASEALAAGYVMTIDYGGEWEAAVAYSGRPHLRIYGPDTPRSLTAADTGRAGANPYRGPTLHDITADVNFGHLVAEGERHGLRPMHFGPQRSLQAGTSVSLAVPPPTLPGTRRLDYAFWARVFVANATFKVLVQQKAGTDALYTYPDSISRRGRP